MKILTEDEEDDMKHKNFCTDEFNKNQLETEKKECKRLDLEAKQPVQCSRTRAPLPTSAFTPCQCLHTRVPIPTSAFTPTQTRFNLT